MVFDSLISIRRLHALQLDRCCSLGQIIVRDFLEAWINFDEDIAGVGSMAESIQEIQRGKPGYEGYLNDRVAALPEILQDAGYFTMLSGKWHLGMTLDSIPHARGFKESFSLLPGAANHYNYEPQLEGTDERPRILKMTPNLYSDNENIINNKTLPSTYYSSDYFTDKFFELFERNTSKSEWCAFLTFSAPHWPLQASPEDMAPYKGRYDAGPDVLREERLTKLQKLGLIPKNIVPHDVVVTEAARTQHSQGDWKGLSAEERAYSARKMEAYAGMVQRMDYNIGRVVNYLEKKNQLDNTFILFMSDNGAEGALLEAMPMMGNANELQDHLTQYYNNSIDNIGRFDSYVWYGK